MNIFLGISWLEFFIGRCTCSSQPNIESVQVKPSPQNKIVSQGWYFAIWQIWYLQHGDYSHMMNVLRGKRRKKVYHRNIGNNILTPKCWMFVCIKSQLTLSPCCPVLSVVYFDDAIPWPQLLYKRLITRPWSLQHFAILHIFFDMFNPQICSLLSAEILSVMCWCLRSEECNHIYQIQNITFRCSPKTYQNTPNNIKMILKTLQKSYTVSSTEHCHQKIVPVQNS